MRPRGASPCTLYLQVSIVDRTRVLTIQLTSFDDDEQALAAVGSGARLEVKVAMKGACVSMMNAKLEEILCAQT